MTTGTSGIVVLRTDAVYARFIRVIAKSNTIRSGFNFFACSIPSTPSAASPHTSNPAFSKKIPIMSRTESPSSMTKTLLRKPCLVGGGHVLLFVLRHVDGGPTGRGLGQYREPSNAFL